MFNGIAICIYFLFFVIYFSIRQTVICMDDLGDLDLVRACALMCFL